MMHVVQSVILLC